MNTIFHAEFLGHNNLNSEKENVMSDLDDNF